MAPAPEQAVLRHGSLYQRLLWLYPASFRNEYRQAMVQVFCDRLRAQAGDRPRRAAARVWLTTLADLAVSVPNQRIEVFMSGQQITAQLTTVIAAVLVSIAAMLFIGFYAVVLLAAATGGLVYQRRRGRYVRLPGQSTWYRWVLSGVAMLAVASLPAILSLGELNEWIWTVFALLTVAGLIAVAVGAAMGMRDRHRGPVTPA